MTDKTLRELISRYADGDLDDFEASRLEARAETDPELASEIETTIELRGAVQALASRMEPPTALDSVMEPMRQAPPVSAQRARPVFRWLGIAAAVVLGVTVATEMARRNPSPTLSRPSPQRDRPVEEREEIFKLAPLPTAVPNDNRPLGAADHLLEESPTLPRAPEPAPLEVIGPLETAAPSDTAAESVRSVSPRATDKDEGFGPRQRVAAEMEAATTAPPSPAVSPDETKSAKAFKADRAPMDDGRESRAGISDTGKGKQNLVAGRQKDTAISATLQIEDIVVWEGSSLGCRIGSWPVQIEVRGGVVRAVEPLFVGGGDEVALSCTPDALIGSRLEDIADGLHLGELLVGDPPK